MTPISRLLTFTLVLLLVLLSTAATTRLFVGQQHTSPEASRANLDASLYMSDSRGAPRLLDRGIVTLSVLALAVTLLLVVSLYYRGGSKSHTQAPFSSRERERRSLSLLAQTSARNQEELSHERDGREKAEADSRHRLQMLNQALEEKIRIGRDLHDDVIQSLYASGLTLETAKNLADRDAEAARKNVDQSLTLINRTISDIRSYIAGLSPRSVRKDSLVGGLSDAVESLRAGRPLDVDWKIDEEVVAELSDAQLAESLQITREAVSNALRHGGAHRILISITRGESGADLLVRDDGKGFNARKIESTGQGLNNMEARARQAMGEFTLTTAPGNGTCIQVSWLTVHSP